MKYEVIDIFYHRNEAGDLLYREPGSSMELSESEAAPLIRKGYLKPVETETGEGETGEGETGEGETDEIEIPEHWKELNAEEMKDLAEKLVGVRYNTKKEAQEAIEELT